MNPGSVPCVILSIHENNKPLTCRPDRQAGVAPSIINTLPD